MTTAAPHLLVFGELLWDLLPAGPQPGGAPANVAIHAHASGICALLVSAIGDDDPGRRMLARLRERNLTLDAIQQIPGAPTGAVDVTLDPQGIPAYRIRAGAAWDQIALTPALLAAAQNARAIYYGTLAQRSPASRATLHALLAAVPPGCQRFFDINLRRPWPDIETIETSLRRTDILKLNNEELLNLAGMLDFPADTTAFAAALFEKHPAAHTMLLTLGPRGAELYARDMLHPIKIPAAPVEKIADTIGAGDAFSAGYLAAMLTGHLPERSAQIASALAARVCQTPGAWLPAAERITL